jgi:hypothetical protein
MKISRMPGTGDLTPSGKIGWPWWAAIVVTAMLIRLPFALDPGLTGDEVIYVLIAKCSAHDILAGVALDDSNPPLSMLLLHGLIRIFGHQVWVWKMTMVAINITSIVILTALFRRWVSKPAAILGGMLAALHPWQIYIATEVRGYALAGLCAVVVLEAADRFERKGSINALILWAVACAAGFWTHYSVAVVALVTGIYLLIRLRRNRRRVAALFVAGTAAIGVMLFWVPAMLRQPINPGGEAEHLWHLAGLPIVQCLGTTFLRPGSSLLTMGIGGLIAAGVYGVASIKGGLHLFHFNRSKLVLVLALLVTTVLVPLLRSLFIGSLAFSTRYTFVANAATLLLVAVGLSEIRFRPRMGLIFGIVFLAGVSLAQFRWVYIGRSWESQTVANILTKTGNAAVWLFPNVHTAMRSRFYGNGNFSPAFVEGPHHDKGRVGVVRPGATWLDVCDSKYRSDIFFTERNRARLRQFDEIWYWSKESAVFVPPVLGPSYLPDKILKPAVGHFGVDDEPILIRYRKSKQANKTLTRPSPLKPG